MRATLVQDLPEIQRILEREVREGVAHFGYEPPTVDQLQAEFEAAVDRFPWFSALDEHGVLIGFAKANVWKPREGYSRTAEIGVYAAVGQQGKGVGSALYEQLLPKLWAMGFHHLVAGIRLPNDPCVRLHEKYGFRKVAHFTQMGFKFGLWQDVGYWELLEPEAESQLPAAPTK